MSLVHFYDTGQKSFVCLRFLRRFKLNHGLFSPIVSKSATQIHEHAVPPCCLMWGVGVCLKSLGEGVDCWLKHAQYPLVASLQWCRWLCVVRTFMGVALLKSGGGTKQRIWTFSGGTKPRIWTFWGTKIQIWSCIHKKP